MSHWLAGSHRLDRTITTIDRPVLDIGHLSVFAWKASGHKSVRSTSAHGILARQVQAEAFAHWRGWRLVRCFSEAVINHKRWFMCHRIRVGWDLPAGSAAIRAGGGRGEQGERVAHTGHWRLTVGESNSWLGSLPSAMISVSSSHQRLEPATTGRLGPRHSPQKSSEHAPRSSLRYCSQSVILLQAHPFHHTLRPQFSPPRLWPSPL